MTYTLYLASGPVEIQARDITEALALGRHNMRVRGEHGTCRLVNDENGKTNHVQRYRNKPQVNWKPAADSPLLGPFNYGLGS